MPSKLCIMVAAGSQVCLVSPTPIVREKFQSWEKEKGAWHLWGLDSFWPPCSQWDRNVAQRDATRIKGFIMGLRTRARWQRVWRCADPFCSLRPNRRHSLHWCDRPFFESNKERQLVQDSSNDDASRIGLYCMRFGSEAKLRRLWSVAGGVRLWFGAKSINCISQVPVVSIQVQARCVNSAIVIHHPVRVSVCPWAMTSPPELGDAFEHSEAFMLELLVMQLDNMNWLRKFETLVSQCFSKALVHWLDLTSTPISIFHSSIFSQGWRESWWTFLRMTVFSYLQTCTLTQIWASCQMKSTPGQEICFQQGIPWRDTRCVYVTLMDLRVSCSLVAISALERSLLVTMPNFLTWLFRYAWKMTQAHVEKAINVAKESCQTVEKAVDMLNEKAGLQQLNCTHFACQQSNHLPIDARNWVSRALCRCVARWVRFPHGLMGKPLLLATGTTTKFDDLMWPALLSFFVLWKHGLVKCGPLFHRWWQPHQVPPRWVLCHAVTWAWKWQGCNRG